jgi:hypothetical protein
MQQRFLSVLVMVFTVVAVACAKSASPGAPPRPSSSSTIITRAELEDVGARTALEAIQRLRPRWLVVRSMRSFSIETVVVAFQDRLLLGTADDALQRVGIDGIYEIEYVDGVTAQATLPGIRDIHVEGAIVLHMSPPSEGPPHR